MKTKRIEEQIKDPVVMKKIIDTILDPKNPDSNKINKEIIKNITNCISKDDAFLTTVKGMVIESNAQVTKQLVQKILDESKEYLTNAMVSIINMRCEEYLKQQRRIVTNAIRTALDKCVDEIIKTTKQSVDKSKQKISKIQLNDNPLMDNVKVPVKYKKQIEDYVDFLSSKSN